MLVSEMSAIDLSGVISHVRCIGGRREIIINDLFQPITLRPIWYAVEISFSQNTY